MPATALFDQLAEVRARLNAAEHLLLGLDYDGTLTPLVNDPDQARLAPEVRRELERLAATPGVTVAIVSGRALDDLRKHVDVAGLHYAGNHGLDIAGPGRRYIESDAVATLDRLGHLAHHLSRELDAVTGARVEHKALTLSVHYRNVASDRRDDLRRRVEEVVAREYGDLRLSGGHEVLEVRPPSSWHKGAALCWIRDPLGGPPPLTCFIGDDRTDEDAFRTLKDAVTVKVGEPHDTAATYHVPSPADVHRFLSCLKCDRAVA